MARSLPTTSYAVLGLLSIAPMSGYELASAADKSIASFWPISKTQVYGELARLEELGFVDGTKVAQERLPDKRVFHVTPAGEEALDRWLESPVSEPRVNRSPFHVRLFFGHRLKRERLRELLTQERRRAEAERDRLAQVVEMLAGYPEAAHARVSALFGLRMNEAVIAWLDEIGQDLPAKEHKPDPRRDKAPTALRLFRDAPPRTRKG